MKRPQPLWRTCSGVQKNVFPSNRFSCVLCPLSLVLLDTTGNSLTVFFAPYIRCIFTLKRSPCLRLLKAEQSQVSQPLFVGWMLWFLNHHQGASANLQHYVDNLPGTVEPSTGHSTPVLVSPVPNRGEGLKECILCPSGSTPPSAAHEAPGHLCYSDILLVHFNLSIRTSCSAKLLSSWFFPSLYWCTGLFLPICRALFCPLSFMRFPSDSFSAEVPVNGGVTGCSSHKAERAADRGQAGSTALAGDN